MDARTSPAQRLGNGIALAGCFVLFALMAMTLANVVSRTFSNTPIPYTTEIAAYWLLPIIAFLGFVVAEAKNAHIEARLIFDRLPLRNQREIQRFTSWVAAVVTLGFSYFSWVEAFHALEIGKTAGVSPIQIWPVLMIVALSFLVFGCQLVWRGLRLAPIVSHPVEVSDPQDAEPPERAEADALLKEEDRA